MITGQTTLPPYICLKTVFPFSNSSDLSQSDLAIDGSRLGVNFHLEVVAYQPTFYDIGNLCSDSDAWKDIQATLQVKGFIMINDSCNISTSMFREILP